VLGKQSKR
jgi:hypothetical protein